MNGDGKISFEEHRAFQEYKKENRNWATALKARPVRKQARSKVRSQKTPNNEVRRSRRSRGF